MLWQHKHRDPSPGRLLPWIAFCVGSVVFVGCGEEVSVPARPTPAGAKKAAEKPKAAADKSTTPKAKKKVFTYTGKRPNGEMRRDPFRSYLADLRAEQVPKSGARPKPTEEFELEQYKLTGLITGTSQPRALVEDPKGVGHTLRIGSRIGKNRGRVKRISPGFILVEEEFRSPTGELVRESKRISLPGNDLKIGESQR